MLCMLPVYLRYLLCFLPMCAVHLPAGISLHNFYQFVRCGIFIVISFLPLALH
jgi:hypothetical protein